MALDKRYGIERGWPMGSGQVGASPTPTPTPTPAPISAVDADGFQATMVAPADLTFAPVSVSSEGYDSTGALTTKTRLLATTKRIRQAYPNQASLTADKVALSDAVLADDVIAGVANSSALVMPKPIVNFAEVDQQLVGNSLTLEVTGNHWAADSKPFACVEFTVTDGTTALTTKTSTLIVSGKSTDQHAVLVYRAVIDITTLAAGVITANAKAYPHIGRAASVADSSTSSVAREFSPRYFYKDVARHASPPLAYVSSAGNDATGVVSTTAATAKATPFLTVQGAINGLTVQTGVTGGYVDGCRVRIMNTVGHGANAGAGGISQRCAALIIERDPDVAKSAAIMQMTAIWRMRLGQVGLVAPNTAGAVQFSDVTFTRTGSFTFQGDSTNLKVQFTNGAVVDYGGANATLCNASHLYFDGASIINCTGSSALTASAGGEIRLLRGVTVDRNVQGVEGWLVLGSTLTRAQLGWGTRSASGAIIQFNRFNSPSASVALIDIGGSADVSQFSFAQIVIENTHNTLSTPSIRLSSDGATGNLTHVLIDAPTMTGYSTAARINIAYDEGATARTHRFVRIRNAVATNIYTKGDWFRGAVESGADASTRIGNWWVMYGVGSSGIFTQFQNPGTNTIGTSEGMAYPGAGADFGTSLTVRNDPLFVDYQGSTASAGAGGGDYHLQSGSPAIGLATVESFAFDLDGNARVRGAVGAYA